jgi:hypothetical protein
VKKPVALPHLKSTIKNEGPMSNFEKMSNFEYVSLGNKVGPAALAC